MGMKSLTKKQKYTSEGEIAWSYTIYTKLKFAGSYNCSFKQQKEKICIYSFFNIQHLIFLFLHPYVFRTFCKALTLELQGKGIEKKKKIKTGKGDASGPKRHLSMSQLVPDPESRYNIL